MQRRGSRDTDALRLHLVVLRCQSGDESAFEELHARFADRTLRYLRSLLDPDAAEDVQQELWFLVYRRIQGLANPRAFRTWLYQTTRHRALDWLRSHRRRSELLEAAAEAADPADAIEEPESLDPENPELEAALASLAPAHRDVLMLRYWEDLTYEEIALVVGVPVGTVRSRLHHARENLRTMLEDFKFNTRRST